MRVLVTTLAMLVTLGVAVGGLPAESRGSPGDARLPRDGAGGPTVRGRGHDRRRHHDGARRLLGHGHLRSRGPDDRRGRWRGYGRVLGQADDEYAHARGDEHRGLPGHECHVAEGCRERVAKITFSVAAIASTTTSIGLSVESL